MRLAIVFAVILFPVAVYAQDRPLEDTEKKAEITIFCANPETDERLELADGENACPEGFAMFRNVTDAYVTAVDGAPLPIPQDKAVWEVAPE